MLERSSSGLLGRLVLLDQALDLVYPVTQLHGHQIRLLGDQPGLSDGGIAGIMLHVRASHQGV